MKLFLILALIFTAVAAAMVPRLKRVTPEPLPSTASTSAEGVVFCAPTTSCGWTIYKSKTMDKIFEMNITNNYCICLPGTECQVYEDDTGANALIYRCMKPENS